jgi:predicted MFS family arabinose efflux permease
VGFLSSTLAAFDAPTRNSYYPSLIPRADFQNAVTLNSVIFRLSTLVGPAIAGVLIAAVSPAAPFFVNAASYFALIFALLLIRTKVPAAAGPRASLGSAMLSGFRYVLRSPVLPLVLLTEGILSVFGHNSALITIFARDVLRVGPAGLGLLLSAVGAGAIVGTIFLIGVGEIRRKGAFLIGGGLVYAVALLAFSVSTSFALSVSILFVLGMADSFWGAMRNTIVQLAATDAFRGRVTSLVTFTSRGLTNTGQIETGAIVSAAGPALAGVINAMVILAAVGAIALRSARLRSFTSTAHVDLEEEPAAP